MKINRADGSAERSVLIGMIVDPHVCGRIASIWNPDLFRNQWARTIAGWCVRYYKKHGKAPQAAIEPMYSRWADGTTDNATKGLVANFLESLNAEYTAESSLTSEYVIDLAADLFTRARLATLDETLQDALAGGDVKEAEEAVEAFSRVELGGSQGIDPWRNKEAIEQAFANRGEQLIVYPGALGQFFSGAFERDSFVSIMAPEKRGKTFWLLDIAWMAASQRRKVAFFQVGDLSQNQIMARIQTRTARRPWKAKTVRYPKSITRQGDREPCLVVHEDRVFEHDLTAADAIEASERLAEKHGASQFMRLSTHPNSTLSVAGMESIIGSWEREGWVPDVIVTDYADILAPPPGVSDPREQINESWKAMRSLSQKLHCCFVTATQSDAASYNAYILDRSHFNGDKRKYGHVTAMFCINQCQDEYGIGVQRLNMLMMRDREVNPYECVHVAGCLDLARPAICSTY